MENQVAKISIKMYNGNFEVYVSNENESLGYKNFFLSGDDIDTEGSEEENVSYYKDQVSNFVQEITSKHNLTIDQDNFDFEFMSVEGRISTYDFAE